MKLGLTLTMIIALGGIAAAQHQQASPPYAGLQQRAVKALSEQQIADLRAGRGMGLALAAELNGYPGPLHVLELADQLDLSADQRRQMRDMVGAMTSEAVPVGEEIIARETELDRAFAEQRISSARMAELTSRIGDAQGRLRAVHLKYHLTTAALLSDHQRHVYAALRGYR
jgi:hypothetical protein